MLREEELLQYVCKGADMGREGIHAVLGYVQDEELKRTLRGQEEVYRTIREEAKGEASCSWIAQAPGSPR